MFLPWWIRKAYRWVRPKRTFLWLRGAHARAVLERLRSTPWYLRGRKIRSPGRRSTYNAIHTGHRIQVLEFWDRLATAAGPVEIRQPFCDRRVVEFASAVPEAEMVRSGEPKGLLRAALGSRLPDLILRRKDKADFAALINQRLIFGDAEAVQNLIRRLHLERLGLVDRDLAWKAYDTYRKRYSSRLSARRR